MKRLYESLLDDDDKLFDDTEHPVILNKLNDPTSEFRKFFKLTYASGYMTGQPIEGQPIDFKNKTLVVNDDVRRHALVSVIDTRVHDKTLGDYCKDIAHSDIDTLECKICALAINTGDKVLDDKAICKNIYAPYLDITTSNISNVNLNIIEADVMGLGRTYRQHLKINSIFDKLRISDTTITNRVSNLNTCLNFNKIPELKNFKTKGFKRMRIYSPMLFDQADPIWNKVFDWTYVGETINGPRKINNIKKLAATANYRKKYVPAPGNNLYKLREDFKLTDLIDISGCKGLEYVIIENNHASIIFAPDLNVIKARAVVINSLCGQNQPIRNGNTQQFKEAFDIPQTADGWYCCVFKND